jgi:hypothetical protein
MPQVTDAVLHVDAWIGIQVLRPWRVRLAAQQRVAGEAVTEHLLGHVAKPLRTPALHPGSCLQAAEVERRIGREDPQAKKDGKEVSEGLLILAVRRYPPFSEQPHVPELVCDHRDQSSRLIGTGSIERDDGPAILALTLVHACGTAVAGRPARNQPEQVLNMIDVAGESDVDGGLNVHELRDDAD